MKIDELEPLEDALRDQSLAELPAGLHRRIMSQVRLTRQPLRFQIRWIDLAVSLFFGLIPVLVAFGWKSLPREAGLYLNYYWMVFQSMNLEPLLWVGILAGLLSLALMFAAALRLLLQPPLRSE
ncbi:MAG: hypothetical protein CVU44_04760 [Chloroflexi bacterium HGW-Chloroflexi-6]|nr:MAG: hypothetical protein CVU44_04760 [Chloroflexi bacterium HGW-Chloroflexi-6]